NADREEHARRAARSIADLALRHPSRAIVVLADRGARDGTQKRIEMHCRLPIADGARLVCYEQILVRARGDADDRLASAVIPLLVPDLPVFLWWTGTVVTYILRRRCSSWDGWRRVSAGDRSRRSRRRRPADSCSRSRVPMVRGSWCACVRDSSAGSTRGMSQVYASRRPPRDSSPNSP